MTMISFDRFGMTLVRQKHKHCSVACLVSIMEDKRLRDQQTEVVKQFPHQFSAGTPDEGMLTNTHDFRDVVIALGLAKGIKWVSDAKEADVRRLQMAENDALLMTTWPSNHTVRIKHVTSSGVEVMNPETGFEVWDWKRLEDSKSHLVILT